MSQILNVFEGDRLQQVSAPETTPGMVLQLADGTIAACNPRAAEILGYTTEQLIGATTFAPLWQSVHEDGSPFELEEYPAIAAWRSRQPVTNVVMGFYRPDGKLAWLKLDAQPLFQANESVPYSVVTTIWDVTPEQQLTTGRSLLDREALNPQLIELESIYTTAPIGLCFVDSGLRFVRINRYLADINGLPISAHIGRTLREILPEQADELEPLYRQAIASGEPRLNLEFHGINRAQPGVKRDWIVSLNPLKQADGRVLGVNVMVQEVTERQRLEQDLREANQRIVTAWESMTDAYLALDREWRITYVNQAASQLVKQLTNLEPEAFLGKTQWEIFPWTIGQVVEQQYRRAMTERVAVHFEVLYEPTGNWFEAHAYPSVEGLGVYFREISDRKQAEIDLRDSEHRYRMLFETIDEGFCVCEMLFDENGKPIDYRFLEINPAFEKMTGLQQAVGKTARQLVPNLEASWFEMYGKVALTGETVRFENCSEAMNRWFDVNAFRIGEAQDRRFAILFTNISDRKHAEAALQSSEERLRLALEASKQGMWFWDLESDTLAWTTQCKALFGLAADAKVTYSVFLNALHPSDRQRTHEAVTQAIDNRVDYDVEYRTQWADGTVRWIAAKGRCTYNAAGQAIYMMGVALDIDERKQAELSLQERHARLNLLYETTNGLLSAEQPLNFISSLFDKLSLQLDLQYYFNFMVEERHNRQMLRLQSYAGISTAAAAAIEWLEFGQGICGLVAQECQQIVVNNVQQSTLPNAYIVRSLSITAYVSQPLIVRGRLLGTLSFASSTRTSFTSEEIALMKAATDQIAVAIERAHLIDSLQQQAQQLIQTNRLKDEFLAVLSHELRSPLNPILGWVKLLQTRKFDEIKTAEALATIERNAQLQVQLIEDLLDISRFMRGKIAFTAAPVSLAYVISSALETVRLAAEAKNIQLQVMLASPTLQVFGDVTRLQQVVWNLLSNGIKFTPHGGRVEISLKEVGSREQGAEGRELREKKHVPLSFPTPDSPKFAQIQVTDTGKGISPEFLPYVFEYFRQEDGSTTRKFGGLGLGLAIAKQIVEMHGGTISADSQGEGRGTTCTVQIPLMQNPRILSDAIAEPASQIINSISLANVRVLLVDDDADTCKFLSTVLEENDAIVTTATSAAEALQILERSRPDLLLSDIGMPETDGYELIRTIRSSSSVPAIPAIALTAYAQDVDRERAIAAGFQRHFAKPLDVEAVISSIAELVQQKTHKF
ncbi:PAS domain S-box protein [Scytonema millei]|uniref:histidine kinase n=1 Tax=Scytonema millei VB511283 TaxID=1245923 RepID=A0A9X5E3Z5_9CYAN|nr:PAS domain S-box protein [Scytonema millei]NHC34734.1 PAS domain S-box protein [Scytonema millei VB511283]